MPLAFLLDENLPRRVSVAIERHNLTCETPIDAVSVGEKSAPQRGSDDASILVWAETFGHILISEDRNTLPKHLGEHLALGRHSPGVFLVRPGIRMADLIGYLSLVSQLSEPTEWDNRVTFIP